ncbi:transcriptional regulator [Roseomonas sp. BN140053]|uniref:transcriptional regulator n=1 Tax=Roseomonas sp. BN140053 TaxID=3391898 RepID=UPI0039E7C13A
MTPEQCSEARKLLGWSRQRLGVLSGTSHHTVYCLETRQGQRRERTVTVIRDTLEAAGIQFVAEGADRGGVRLHRPPE